MNYFSLQDVDNFTFFRIPKVLFTSERYKKYSAECKVLYGLLLDRSQLSKENGWVDEEGRVYIYFTRETAEEMLGIKRDKAMKLFKELRNADLIDEIQQGLNKPNIIYVKKFIEEKAPRSQSYQLKSEKPTSGIRKNRLQGYGKTDPNDTYVINTYVSDTESQSVSQKKEEKNKQTKKRIKVTQEGKDEIIKGLKIIYGDEIVNSVLEDGEEDFEGKTIGTYEKFMKICCEDRKKRLKKLSVSKISDKKFTHEHPKADLDEAIRKKTLASYREAEQTLKESAMVNQ